MTHHMKVDDGITCECRQIGESSESNEATSCGLDIWHSKQGLQYTNAYLHAETALLRAQADGNHASVLFQLRHLPGGVSLASAYPYGRIVGDVSLFWRAVPVVAKTLRKKGILRLEIPFTGPYLHQLELASESSVMRIPDSMAAVRHVIDMASSNVGELDRHFDPNTRWAIRKAKRNGCLVRTAAQSEIDGLQDIYVRTMHAKRAPVNYGRERWEGIASLLAPAKRGCLYIGEIEGQPRGMAAVVDGAASRHLIQLAVSPEAHSSRLGELLIMSAISDACSKGLRYFDFMASSATDKGLIAFKAKWGATAEPIRYAVISGIPGLQRIVDLARWINRTRARLHVP